MKACYTTYFSVWCGMIISGCTSSPAVEDSSNPDVAATTVVADEPLQPYQPGSTVTCRYEKPVGSHMMRKICSTASDDERNQRATRDLLRSGRLPRSIVIRDTTPER